MTLEEIRRTIRDAAERAREAYAATHSAWDHADDARIAYDEGDDRDDINNHVLEAVDYAARAELEIDVVSDILDALVDDLDDMIDGNGEADAPLVIDPAATDRYIAQERYDQVTAALSHDPLVLLRGIADNTGAIGAAFALRLFAVFTYAAIAYGAFRTMGAWSLAPLAVLTFGIFWAPRGRALVRRSGFSGHHARAHTRTPWPDRFPQWQRNARAHTRDLLDGETIAAGVWDIAEVGGRLWLFTAAGWREIVGVRLGILHAFADSGDAFEWAYPDPPAAAYRGVGAAYDAAVSAKGRATRVRVLSERIAPVGRSPLAPARPAPRSNH